MITRYFKVIVAKSLPINFSIQDLRKAPHSYFEMKEYSEHIVEVVYKLDPSTEIGEFEKLIKKAIRGNYSNIHSIQEVGLDGESIQDLDVVSKFEWKTSKKIKVKMRKG